MPSPTPGVAEGESSRVTAVILLLAATLALAWANGANDVSKGVAALVGAGVATPAVAWLFGVGATFAGGVAALVWGDALNSLFSGGFLEGVSELSIRAAFAALAGAAGFVLLATWRRWPVSTTHALIGGIIGAAGVEFGAGRIDFGAVAGSFMIPLLASPFLAIGLCWVLLRLNRLLEARLPQWSPGCCDYEAYEKDPFLCTPDEKRPSPLVRRFWLALHWVSGGAVGFARGLNDVPKIAALMIPALAALPAFTPDGQGPATAIALTAFAMTGGALMAGRRLLPVLAKQVASITPSTGLFANFGTAALVLGATPLGLPVSTTHVSGGSLIGVRVADHAPPRAEDALHAILVAWLVTMPSAAAIAAVTALAVIAAG